MSAQDKINLDETLPNAIAKEVQDRKDAIAALESSSNASIEALEKKHDDFVATKGQANGFASLDGNGLVPSSQLLLMLMMLSKFMLLMMSVKLES